VREHDAEPVRGLPQRLPEGESLLWQGAPRWMALAVHAFHVRKVAIYFAALIVWRIAAGIADRDPALKVALDCAWLAVAALAAAGVLLALAWFAARATVYTITDQRVVMRFGMAISFALNLPFRRIEAAQLNVHHDGTGDIALALGADDHIAYVHLWPHARPWRLARPEPMLRALADPQHVALVLARAVATTGAAASIGAPRSEATPDGVDTGRMLPATN
jgi:hypothetical protein